MKKICFITGTRAEYGLLSPLMRLVADSPSCQLQVIATNMHLMPEHGSTYREIEADGFSIDAKVPMPKLSDDAYGVVASMATEMQGINDAVRDLAPDIVVILGDRYEMLVAASVCLIHQVPIAHIHGGETTEGAYDDAIRHSISQMASVHFPAAEPYRQRLIQMGIDPATIHCVGALGVENLQKVPTIDREQLESELGISLGRPLLLATYHPVTRSGRTADQDIREFLTALDAYPGYDVIFTLPNSDQGGDAIRRAILDYCDRQPERCHAFPSLGMRRYLSLMRLATAVLGNSSSGIIEAPTAGVPTLNIGDRQKGRARGESVTDCAPDAQSIIDGIARVTSPAARDLAHTAPNPYAAPAGAPGTAAAILSHLLH